MTYHHYNKDLKYYARELRTETVSKAERFIWKSLLRKKQLGYRFLRQRPISHYIVDFFAPDLKLIIEIDGTSHNHKQNYDARRQAHLEGLGYTMLRFKEGEVLNNLSEVHQQITHAIFCMEKSV